MTATRPSDAPYGPQDAGSGSEVGPDGARPPQGDTAPHRPIDWTAIAHLIRAAVKRAHRTVPEEYETRA